MPFEARQFNSEADYPVLDQWWKEHGWTPVPQAILPKCGIVVQEGDTMRAAAFLYMDNSIGFAMLEWIVTNPKNTGKQSYAAITHLIGAIKATAELFDYGIIFTSAKQEGLIKILERNGATKADSGMTHLLFTKKENNQW